jgi:uncharacterized protein YjbI with pentapeptide repeats
VLPSVRQYRVKHYPVKQHSKSNVSQAIFVATFSKAGSRKAAFEKAISGKEVFNKALLDKAVATKATFSKEISATQYSTKHHSED